MDCRTGEILRASAEEISQLEDAAGRKFAQLTEAQADALEPLPNRKRKNKMRNQPCVCGSGRKFKKCCWGQYR